MYEDSELIVCRKFIAFEHDGERVESAVARPEFTRRLDIKLINGQIYM